MKDFKKFLSESITINGDFNGTLNVSGSQPNSQNFGESYVADVMWQGSLYRMDINCKDLPTREHLGEQIQREYPGAVVHNIYPANVSSNSTLRITGVKRYQPEKLTWTQE